jgi:hypothetical protein
LTINHNAGTLTSTVALTGTGVAPAAPVVVTSATATIADTAFGTIRRGVTKTRTVLVTNTGTANLLVTGINSPVATPPFTVALGTCNVAVAPGRTCKLDVTYSPTGAVISTATLTLVSNATNSPSGALSGTGR